MAGRWLDEMARGGLRRQIYPLDVAVRVVPVALALWVGAIRLAINLASQPDPNRPQAVEGVVEQAYNTGYFQHGSYVWAVTFTYTRPTGEPARDTASVYRDRRLPDLQPGDVIAVPARYQFNGAALGAALVVFGGLAPFAANRLGQYWLAKRRPPASD